jgi:hypothetical protein
MGEFYPENRAKRIFSIECFFAPNDSRNGSIRTYLGFALNKRNQMIMSIRQLLTRMAQRYAKLLALKYQKSKENEP